MQPWWAREVSCGRGMLAEASDASYAPSQQQSQVHRQFESVTHPTLPTAPNQLIDRSSWLYGSTPVRMRKYGVQRCRVAAELESAWVLVIP